MEYLIATGLFIAAIIFAFLQGKKSGKDSTTTEVQAKVLEDVEQAKQIQDHINTLSDDSIRDRLRKRNR